MTNFSPSQLLTDMIICFTSLVSSIQSNAASKTKCEYWPCKNGETEKVKNNYMVDWWKGSCGERRLLPSLMTRENRLSKVVLWFPHMCPAPISNTKTKLNTIKNLTRQSNSKPRKPGMTAYAFNPSISEADRSLWVCVLPGLCYHDIEIKKQNYKIFLLHTLPTEPTQ